MNQINLQSKRLNLRLINHADLTAIHKLHILPETDKFNTLGIPKNILETETIINSWILDTQKEFISNYTFAIEQKADGQFIGLFGLKSINIKYKRGEVWYKLHSDYWGHGYATESLSCILNYAFDELKLHRIEAGCAVDNIASFKVLEKVGMTREGRKREVLPLINGWSDNFEYAILEADTRKK